MFFHIHRSFSGTQTKTMNRGLTLMRYFMVEHIKYFYIKMFKSAKLTLVEISFDFTRDTNACIFCGGMRG